MEYFAEGSRTGIVDSERTRDALASMLDQLGPLRRALLVPPDLSRFHSGAGEITCMLWQLLGSATTVEILPAVGTHRRMTAHELDQMFPGIPHERFRVHDWRKDVAPIGEIEAEFVEAVSGGALRASIKVELANIIKSGRWDAVISIGQLVPHEVAGIANHNKNILVGCGGSDFINKSHFVGAAFGMERIMGRAETPVRAIFNEAEKRYLADVPIRWVLTVREQTSAGVVTRGLFAGDDNACFLRGAELCRQVNLNVLDREIKKAVVWLDPHEFKSTWLGNKAIYRTRMAMADGGELIVLAPGVREFGEDESIDMLIRKYGYRGTPATLDAVKNNADLSGNLSAAAHLIHGSSEGRFRITYCPGLLSKEEIVDVGFNHMDLGEARQRFDPEKLQDGWNTVEGEEVFFVRNPGLGLWGVRSRFGDS